MPRIRWVADDDREALVPFDFVHGGGFVGEGTGNMTCTADAIGYDEAAAKDTWSRIAAFFAEHV